MDVSLHLRIPREAALSSLFLPSRTGPKLHSSERRGSRPTPVATLPDDGNSISAELSGSPSYRKFERLWPSISIY